MATTPALRRLTGALPPILIQDDDALSLKAGWFTGCKPVAYIFFAIGLLMVWLGVQFMGVSAKETVLYWGCLVIPTFGVALWMAAHRTHWRLDRQSITKLSGLRLRPKQTWPADDIHGVEMVDQFHDGGRFSQLAPGIHLLAKHGRRIDLGAHGDRELVETTAHAVAEFYAVPFEDHSREETVRNFQRRKLRIFLTALAIAAVLVILDRVYSGS